MSSVNVPTLLLLELQFKHYLKCFIFKRIRKDINTHFINIISIKDFSKYFCSFCPLQATAVSAGSSWPGAVVLVRCRACAASRLKNMFWLNVIWKELWLRAKPNITALFFPRFISVSWDWDSDTTPSYHIPFLWSSKHCHCTDSAISMWNDSESIVDNKIKYKYKHKSHYVLNGHV